MEHGGLVIKQVSVAKVDWLRHKTAISWLEVLSFDYLLYLGHVLDDWSLIGPVGMTAPIDKESEYLLHFE